MSWSSVGEQEIVDPVPRQRVREWLLKMTSAIAGSLLPLAHVFGRILVALPGVWTEAHTRS